jgi:hypothetical protein
MGLASRLSEIPCRSNRFPFVFSPLNFVSLSGRVRVDEGMSSLSEVTATRAFAQGAKQVSELQIFLCVNRKGVLFQSARGSLQRQARLS